MGVGAWLRRIIASFGVSVTSYFIMLVIMLLSVLYDREMEPIIKVAFNTGRALLDWFDGLVRGNHWGQVAVNHMRERVNMTHVVLSIPAILIAAIIIGVPLNWLLGGTRSILQRLSIAILSIPATVLLAVALFTFNAIYPNSYRALLRFADEIWKESLTLLSMYGDHIPGARKLANAARQGFSGHHYVIMALCAMAASFIINSLFALFTRRRT